MKKLSSPILLALTLTACGGGEDSTSPDNNPPHTSSDSATVVGRAIISKTSTDVALRYKPSDIEMLANNTREQLGKKMKAVVNSLISNAHAADFDIFTAVSVKDVLCYSRYEIDKLPKDIDTDSDGLPDANITDSTGTPIKDIIPGSDQLDLENIVTWEYEPTVFLFDYWGGLEPNKLNEDGITLNVESSEGYLLFNLDTNHDQLPDLNIIDFSEGQPEGVGILNFDSNYDGRADLNIDRDRDGIADTNIDEDNDCVADYSFTSPDGAIVAPFADVELLDKSDWSVIAKTQTDVDGKFTFENVKTTEYFIKVIADAGSKNVGAVKPISINADEDISDISLYSRPILIEVSSPNSHFLTSSSELREGGTIDLTQYLMLILKKS